MIFFLAESTRHLRPSLVKHGCSIGQYKTSVFADGERGYLLEEEVAGKPIILIASVLPRPESLFDLMALFRLLHENGATDTTVIIPYLGYARQDRPKRKGEASIGLMIVEILESMKAPKLVMFDVHSDLIRRSFNPSIAELSALPLFAAAFAKRPPNVIIAPDAGALKRAEGLARLLRPHPEVALIDKVRTRPNVAKAKKLHGDVEGKDVLIIDDMIDTGGTIAEAVKLALRNGAAVIRVAATHAIFSGGAKESLSPLPISEILVTNSLPRQRRLKTRSLDIVPLILGILQAPR